MGKRMFSGGSNQHDESNEDFECIGDNDYNPFLLGYNKIDKKRKFSALDIIESWNRELWSNHKELQ